MPWCDGSHGQSVLREALHSGWVRVETFNEKDAGPGTADGGRRCRTVVVPLIVDGQILGALTLCFGSDPVDREVDQEFGEQLAFGARQAIENAKYRAVARDANETMNNRLRAVSHDLSTPLAVLSLALETGLDQLQRGGVSDTRMFHRALGQVDQLTVMINELAAEGRRRSDTVGLATTDFAACDYQDGLRSKG
jgi:K+-sensing histidine kinase KdpD